ncbi:DUF4349 domain-containing protein [Tenacibaculum geojense]|uniref:DUF4349 domain-containing protein n=1 Tax=Tenacibaculum geojense TaxID=915352 RepID=A0ABW3JRK6_9FLAO
MKIITHILFSFIVLLGCSGNSNSFEDGSITIPEPSNIAYDITEDVKTKSVSGDFQESKSIERKLIKTGNISFETSDISNTRNRIEEALKKVKGYISEDNQYKNGNNVNYTITVRVPADSFDTFLNDISKDVDKFDHKNISVNDVTEQFLDVEARLKVKTALELRYNNLLSKANSVKDILEIERELAKVRSEIESIQGRLNYLQNQVGYSTLQISYYKITYGSSSSSSFGTRLINAFINGVDNVKWFLLSLVSIWPFLLLGFITLIILKKRKQL